MQKGKEASTKDDGNPLEKWDGNHKVDEPDRVYDIQLISYLDGNPVRDLKFDDHGIAWEGPYYAEDIEQGNNIRRDMGRSYVDPSHPMFCGSVIRPHGWGPEMRLRNRGFQRKADGSWARPPGMQRKGLGLGASSLGSPLGPIGSDSFIPGMRPDGIVYFGQGVMNGDGGGPFGKSNLHPGGRVYY